MNPPNLTSEPAPCYARRGRIERPYNHLTKQMDIVNIIDYYNFYWVSLVIDKGYYLLVVCGFWTPVLNCDQPEVLITCVFRTIHRFSCWNQDS